MTTQKMSVYRFDWQIIRVNLDFTTAETTAKSLSTIIEYLEMFPERGDTRDNKLYRVLNMLNAVLMGQNGQKKRVTTDKQLAEIALKDGFVRELRDQVATEYHKNKIHNFYWDEEIERENIRSHSMAEIKQVLDNLKKRSKFASTKKKVDVYKTRPQLVKYIVMLEQEYKAKAK